MNEKNKVKKENKKFKMLNPKNDIVFQMLFSSVNPEITKGLISSMIDEEITSIELDLSKELKKEKIDDKIGILDLRAKINNNIECEIEMQMIYAKNFMPRLLYYWSKVYSQQLKEGQNYEKLKKTISIAIMNEKIPEIKEMKAHTKWQIREEKTYRKILTDKLEIHIIEIPKAIEEYKKNKGNTALQWMMFLNEPESMEVEEIMKENKEIKEAKVTLRELSEEEENQRIAELREKHILDTQDIYETALEKGLQEGIEKGLQKGIKKGLQEGREKGLQEGREKGMQKGIQKGIQKGLEIGKKERTLAIAKKLLKIEMPIEKIIEVTELTKKEIEKIIKENK